MHIKSLKKYFFIDKFDYFHFINLDKNISFIWRNKDKETEFNNLVKLKNFCKKNNRQFFISNNLKLAIKLNADGIYISSYNKNLNLKLINLKKNFKILGSAHNFKEIKIKELQRVEEIFLSPLFKKKNNSQLNIYRYLRLKKSTILKDISLGGINRNNIKKLKLINPFGFAAISYFKKKGL
jgi:thiamine-phosphate pyrophosphorylase